MSMVIDGQRYIAVSRRKEAIRNGEMTTLRSVSYTHLDVYRRQPLTMASAGVASMVASRSVSYTHLDVYKRQAIH